jgi:hypothetical protein
MRWVCSTCVGEGKYVNNLSQKLENLLGDVVVGGRIKLVSREGGVRLWTGCSWFRISSSCHVKVVFGCVLDVAGLEYRPITGFRKRGNES